MWRASVLTIFPEMFPGPLGLSLAGKALAGGLWGAREHRHPRPGDRPAPLGRRHAGRRRSRHGDAARRAGARARRRGPSGRRAPAPLDEPARPSAYPGAGRSARPRARRDHPVRPFRGRRRTRDRRPHAAGDLDRRLSCCRAARSRPARCIDACIRLLPGVMGKEASGGRGELHGGPARIPAIHPARSLGRPPHPGGADRGRSRQGQGLAPSRGRAPHPRASPGPVGGLYGAAGGPNPKATRSQARKGDKAKSLS